MTEALLGALAIVFVLEVVEQIVPVRHWIVMLSALCLAVGTTVWQGVDKPSDLVIVVLSTAALCTGMRAIVRCARALADWFEVETLLRLHQHRR